MFGPPLALLSYFPHSVQPYRPSLSGVVMASVQPGVVWNDYWVAILLTALSALAQAALLVYTRRAGRLLGLKASFEVAAVKALVAACVLLPLAGGIDPHGFARMSMLEPSTIGFLVGGAGVTALFQVSLSQTCNSS